MADIEKVKQGLDRCKHGDGKYCFVCPYAKENKKPFPPTCNKELCRDALSVIEQLQQELEKGPETCRMDDVGPDMKCSGCGETIDSEIYHMIGMRRIRYCPLCGRSVKWDD